MKWARHMVRMKDERLPKRAETKKQGVERKLGRLQVLRWKDHLKRRLRKAAHGKKKSEERKGLQQRTMEGNTKRLLSYRTLVALVTVSVLHRAGPPASG